MVKQKEIRDDHKKWRCMQMFRTEVRCYRYNDMDIKQCANCKAKRDAGDEAINANLDKIGKLDRVEKDGTEWWEYD
ncbi:hypothetical protein BHE90_007856 [Fusarium euwallaceae]|uniref:RanBP2-type domain-containing protein n=3 Tax=Fusarium solani species complex TaxID=232080 RepID=A0A3M2RT28_9HYPO|nr:hypothetical protein CDV36_011911 [Fusarium kuroshium]RSL75510.1 hypothetical protein CEP51_010791 [Fusarium floridanum]RTE77646.1 hypothetical protein BHE90_007856 [Fusarium euwallaceae]